MSIESRLDKLEAAFERKPHPARDRMQAFIATVRRDARIVHLNRLAAVAKQLEKAAAAEVYERQAAELVYPLAVKHLGAIAAAKYAPDPTHPAA